MGVIFGPDMSHRNIQNGASRMNPLSALQLMVKHHPLGLDGVAILVNKSAKTVGHELRGDPGFKMGVVDACIISADCIERNSPNCHAYANAVAAQCGGFVELPVIDMSEPTCVNRTMGDVIREMSDVSTSTIEGDSDDNFSDNDLARSLKEIGEARAALQRHELALRRKHAAGKRGRE